MRFKKRNKINVGRNPWNKGKRHSDETKRKMSEAAKNRKPISEETRRKLRDRTPWNKGKTGLLKHSDETKRKRKIREARKHQIFSEEHRRKLSDVQKGRKHSEESRVKR